MRIGPIVVVLGWRCFCAIYCSSYEGYIIIEVTYYNDLVANLVGYKYLDLVFDYL